MRILSAGKLPPGSPERRYDGSSQGVVKMGLFRKTMLFILAVIMTIPGPASAASNELDIDLKELRASGSNAKPQPAKPAKHQRHKLRSRNVATSNRTGNADSSRISIASAPPCTMARDMAAKMGLLAAHQTAIREGETFSATSAGLNVTVACQLSKAELYTYERLLTRTGSQLLLFEGGESGERVVEKLANYLGLAFRKLASDSDTLPMTYIFAPFGTRTEELQMIILPTPLPPSR